MVITKGSGRVSEVAARFTLDALPGKQMSIDADLAAARLQSPGPGAPLSPEQATPMVLWTVPVNLYVVMLSPV